MLSPSCSITRASQSRTQWGSSSVKVELTNDVVKAAPEKDSEKNDMICAIGWVEKPHRVPRVVEIHA